MINLHVPGDTSFHAQSIQDGVLRKMDISQRAEMTFELNANVRAAVEAGVRSRHPEYDDKTVGMAVTKLMIGDSLFKEAFGDIELEP
ncbi:MAG TPA: hypothetical protein HPP87_13905 [Planctomycetes bacterium]|nr:hypothetical protein [Planctomycetota bacterium]